jgi:hypothetical protein
MSWYDSFLAGSVGVRSQSSAVNTVHSFSSNETHFFKSSESRVYPPSPVKVAMVGNDIGVLVFSLELERDILGDGLLRQLLRILVNVVL